MQRDPQLFAVIPEGRQIIDFCNLLTHEYLNVSDPVVWGAIQADLPVLIDHCRQLLNQQQPLVAGQRPGPCHHCLCHDSPGLTHPEKGWLPADHLQELGFSASQIFQ
jgi:hypothetical protein